MRLKLPSRPGWALLAVLGTALGLSCQDPPRELGPADGRDLAPFDTGRVAIGDTAPGFTLRNRHGEPVSLKDLRGRRIVLVFYRGFW